MDRPFYVVRRQQSLWTTAREPWSQNTKLYYGDAAKPTYAVAPPRTPGEPVLIILGLGEVYREELSEMAERVRETRREPRTDPNRQSDLIRDAFERRMQKHRANSVTDPAPVYVR